MDQNPQPKGLKDKQRINKLINRSKSTVNDSLADDLEDLNKKRLVKIEQMKKEGLIDFSFEP